MATREALPRSVEAQQTYSYLQAAQPAHTALNKRWERSRNLDKVPLDAALNSDYEASSKVMNRLLETFLPLMVHLETTDGNST